MPYNANIPQSTDRLKDSQPLILANFQAIQALIDVDHVDFALPNMGKHNFVHLPTQAAPPVTNATEVALFSQVATVSGVPELFFMRNNNPAITSNNAITMNGNTANEGYTVIPSGLIIKWGTAVQIAANPTVVAFPVAANRPVYTNIFTVMICIEQIVGDPNAAVYISAQSAVNFTVNSFQRNAPGTFIASFIRYIAIGN